MISYFFNILIKKDIFYKNSFFFSGKSRLTFFSLAMEYRTFYEEWWRWWLFKKDDGFVLHYLIVPVLDEPSDRNCFAINHFLMFDHRKSKWFVSDYKIKGNRKCRFTPSLWILKKVNIFLRFQHLHGEVMMFFEVHPWWSLTIKTALRMCIGYWSFSFKPVFENVVHSPISSAIEW